MKKSFSLLFYLKKSKSKFEKSPIYLRITVEGKRAEISLQRTIEEKKWNKHKNKARGHNEDAKTINEYLDVITSKVYKFHRELIETEKDISAIVLKNLLVGKSDHVQMLIPHIKEQNRRAKLELATNTWKNYRTLLMHTEKFLMFQYNTDDISIKKINHQFITDFEFFLKTEQNLSHNVMVKYLMMFKKHIHIAIKYGWISTDPYLHIIRTYKKTERVYLNQAELDRLANKEITIKRLEQVRDVFLFACYTGLAFAELAKLNKGNIVIGLDRGKWINIHRTKTNSLSKIPILPSAQNILDKYSNNPLCLNTELLLPIISNQRYNGFLKEIAAICGINKNLTSHTARHTFSTTITLNNGVSMEAVSSMLGHSKISTTQIYSKITSDKVSNEMKALKSKLEEVKLGKINGLDTEIKMIGNGS